MYQCQHFQIQEFVNPEIYAAAEQAGITHLLWSCIDDRMVRSADLIWDHLNSASHSRIVVDCNDWLWGGNFTESGLRHIDSSTGALLSSHKFGRALDLRSKAGMWSPEELRIYMRDVGCFEPGFRDRRDTLALPFIHITRIEWRESRPMSWFHMDCSPIANDDGSIKIIWV